MNGKDRSAFGVSVDALFGLLANETRRALLAQLAETDQPQPIMRLAEALASEHHDVPNEEIPAGDLKRTHLELYHTHLPKFAAAGVIEFRRQEGLVVPTDDVTVLHSWLAGLLESIGEEGFPGVSDTTKE